MYCAPQLADLGNCRCLVLSPHLHLCETTRILILVLYVDRRTVSTLRHLNLSFSGRTGRFIFLVGLRSSSPRSSLTLSHPARAHHTACCVAYSHIAHCITLWAHDSSAHNTHAVASGRVQSRDTPSSPFRSPLRCASHIRSLTAMVHSFAGGNVMPRVHTPRYFIAQPFSHMHRTYVGSSYHTM